MTIDGPGSPPAGGGVGGANVGAMVMPAEGNASGLRSGGGASLDPTLDPGLDPGLDPELDPELEPELEPVDAEGLTSPGGGVVPLGACSDGTTAAGSQLAIRLLTANTAMSATTAKKTKPMAR